MFRYRCRTCRQSWSSTAACPFCPFCPFTFSKPELLEGTAPSGLENEAMTCPDCSATVRVARLELERVNACPTCGTRRPQPGDGGSGEDDERAVQEELGQERMRLLGGIRNILRCTPQSHVLCLGASKHLALVYSATQAGQYTFVSLDANDVGERVRVLKLYHPELDVKDRSSIGAYTDRIILKGPPPLQVQVRFLCLGYDAFFEKNPDKRYDVLIDKASWIFSDSNAAGRYLASLNAGGYWITDNDLDYGQAPWLLSMLGLTNETARLNDLARIGYGYLTALIYRRTGERSSEVLTYVMAYCQSVRQILRSIRDRLRYGSDVLEPFMVSAMAIRQMKPMLVQAGLGTQYEQALSFWEEKLPALRDADEDATDEDPTPEVEIPLPAQQTLQGHQLMFRFANASKEELSTIVANTVLREKQPPFTAFTVLSVEKSEGKPAMLWTFKIERR
ncbi:MULTISPECIES: hypothetical protein [unclassified Corallococcus]|uniref:hypothetical protein n=1 Tax=unclassified Corallococcus TaxID=2685029 RepID=UPI001A90451F|nr:MULTISPECIES: hypothetical protein [unclassified Corallococcus]MBN9685207.1 hypothetical protein [Corallococcus sp. NCSPR001]WAS83334.1 hypothetical protein O0N60_28965 [Corallococcus sp. NCRR]